MSTPGEAPDDDAEVIDLDAARDRHNDELAAEISDSMARHPAGRRPRRVFRRPGIPDPD